MRLKNKITLSLVTASLILSSTLGYASSMHSFKEVNEKGKIIGTEDITGIELELKYDENDNLHPLKTEIGLFENNTLIKSVTMPKVSINNKVNFGEVENYSKDKIYNIKYRTIYTVLGEEEKEIVEDWKDTNKYFKITKVDNKSPALTIENNPTKWTNEDVTLTITATEEEDGSGIKEITLPDGTTIAPEGEEIALELTTKYTVTENGSYTFKAEDNAGNVTEETVVIDKIDKIAPTKPQITNIENTLVLTEATDDLSGIDKHLYSINDNDWLVWNEDIDLSNFADGDYTIKIKAVDKAGNESEIFELNFTVGNDLEDKIKDIEDAIDNLDNLDDLDDIQNMIDDLPDGEEKDRLQDELDKKRRELENKEYEDALREATEAVEKAEETKLQEDVDSARDLVNQLPDGEDKDNLNDRLDAVQDEINAQKEYEDALRKATEAVEKAEETKLQEDVDSARDLVNQLPDGQKKDELNERLNKVQEEIDYEKLLEEAIKAVEKAEETLSQNDVKEAYKKVNKLKDSPEKTELINRLKEVERKIAERLAKEKAEKEAIQAVELAEALKREPYIQKAKDKVALLEEGELKTSLEERLLRLEEMLNQDSESTIKNAERLVELAEILKREPHITKAKEAVNNLKPSNKKTELLLRLQALKERRELNEEDKALMKATQAVELAEQYGYPSLIKRAIELVNALPDSEEKNALLERLGLKVIANATRVMMLTFNVETLEDAKITKSADNTIKVATYYVEQAEKYNIASVKRLALEKVNKLQTSKEKQELLNRLEALNK